ncbi:MAG: 2-oxo acid dehydrogenase subunit E2 [Chitinophagales bacterium]|jgi:pyruvate dehydrogenase E2 component (dihydrolipoamide acetyltransferase)|nr:2-oxo acid dehydrogenase subunit E2 [Chitinophagales bacterium]
MAEKFLLPRMSDTMEEGVIANMIIKVGDQVKVGTVIAEVETDKATMELESFQEGEVLYVAAKSGDSVPVNGLLAILGKKGEDFSALLQEAHTPSVNAEEKTQEIDKTSPSPSLPSANSAPQLNVQTAVTSSDRTKISPLAKKMAETLQVDLNAIQGSGDDGRIVKKDIESAAQNPSAPKPTQVSYPSSGFEEIKVSQMRKVIAQRLAESKFSAPHFYLKIKVNMDNCIDAREKLNSVSEVKISYNDIIIKACAMALKKHPYVNASWLGDKIRLNFDVHIGMAVAVPDGLLVPVIKHADQISLSQIANQSKDFASRAKNKQITPDEMKGNTFSISNLGMMGIDEFTAIINPPDACILAVGTINKSLAMDNSGNLYQTNELTLTLSCDHRVVDGAVGSKFLNEVKSYLENPLNMLL